jgi:hypothetical protein
VAGFENDFAPVAAAIGRYSPAKAADLRLITNDELEMLIHERRVRIIVDPINTVYIWGHAGRPWDAIVQQAGYRKVRGFRGKIWIRPDTDEASH